MRGIVTLAVAGLVCLPAASRAQGQPGQSGAALFRAACASCHGPDGKGMPQSHVGFDIPLPDFTDCSFASPEADADWMAVVHQGGPARAFDRMMPAFGDALSEDDLGKIIAHLRTLCADRRWPRGDLNLPRPLATEKAFPENEAVLTVSVDGSKSSAIVNEFLYERRVGRRGQWEAIVSFAVQEGGRGEWRRGLGDVALAYKHVVFDSLERGSILSAGSELIFPTGKENEGLGRGVTVLEPFGTFSQMLPAEGFVHLHGGVELPIATDRIAKEAFWRAAIGKTFTQHRWGRAWSPMLEVLGAREIEDGAPVQWDLLPQIQVSLSTRQHVLFNAGVRVPINRRQGRGSTLMVYLLWDWFDGGLFSGW